MTTETVRCPGCGKTFALDSMRLIRDAAHDCRTAYGDPMRARLAWDVGRQMPFVIPIPPPRG